MKNKIRILIADDHFIVRMGLIALVNTESDLEVVAEAADGVQAVKLCAQCEPDIAVLDLRMPVKDGIQACREIKKAHPNTKILILSTFDGDEDIHKALQAGAQGYVLKNSTGDSLIPALRAVGIGQRWIPKEVASRLAARKTYEELTPRETEVLQLLSRGLANKEIADKLQISEYTVKDYLKSLLGKLRVADRTEAVTAAIQRGIIHL